MARLRTFLAVDLSKNQKDRCVKLQELLAKSGSSVNWVDRNHFHITLLFLGEIEYLEVATVCQVVREVTSDFPSFPIHLHGLNAFPAIDNPRTLFVSLSSGMEELSLLYRKIEEKMLEAVRYRREVRPYLPHVTLGRLKEKNTPELSDLVTKNADWDCGEHRVLDVQVLTSQLREEGPIYTLMGRGQLKGK